MDFHKFPNASSKLLQKIEKKARDTQQIKLMRGEFKWVFTIFQTGFPKICRQLEQEQVREQQPWKQPSGEGRCGVWCCEHEDEMGKMRKDWTFCGKLLGGGGRSAG